MLCCECGESLIDLSKRVYYCKECSKDPSAGDMIYWCNKCKEATEHEHKRSKLKTVAGAPKEEDDEKAEKQNQLDDLLQSYYDLDCEDIIGGGTIKTRFKYTSVPKEDYGLSAEEIFLLDDKQLNKMVSMKHLRTYKHLDASGKQLPEEQLNKFKPNKYKIRQMKQEFKNEIEQKRKLVRENQEANRNLEKEQYLGTKNSMNKAERKKYKQEKKNKNLKYSLLAKRKAEQTNEE